MACASCGKARASRAGNSPSSAIIFGDVTDEVVRVRFTGDVPGFQPGSIKYVRGSALQDYYDDGRLTLLSGSSRDLPLGSQTVVYYVGQIGFTTIEAARIQSKVTGEDISVVTLE
jgi:hypothetical protein